jgi:hypothetical protein
MPLSVVRGRVLVKRGRVLVKRIVTDQVTFFTCLADVGAVLQQAQLIGLRVLSSEPGVSQDRAEHRRHIYRVLPG